MSTKTKVVLVGASGVTGRSIAQAVLANPEQFELSAFVREASLMKPELLELQDLGATLQVVDLDGPVDDTAKLLAGVDVVISTMTLMSLPQELNLISAAKKAGVGRFVPSFFGPVCPPKGGMPLRDAKEDILNHIRKLYLPYTAIDIGWWYQMVVPRRPQDVDPNAYTQPMPIIDEGAVKIGLTDNRDIGQFVARIIVDKRTLNRLLFAYGEVKTLAEAWTEVDDVFGTTVKKEHTSEQNLLDTMEKHKHIKLEDEGNMKQRMELAMAQYYYSIAVRGDNAPEKAKYLGYLDVRELYPDVEPRSWRMYLEEVKAGTVKAPYTERGL